MQITVMPTPLKGLLLIEAEVFKDQRGFFMESYSKRDFAGIGIHDQFVQENHSRSEKGVLRGLHYQNMQAPMAKLVRCTLGKVYDVAVDIRATSKTLGQWFGVELSEENKKMLYVPVGFAHGFETVSDIADLQYRQTDYYTPEAEGAIMWNDPDLNIPWPIQNPLLSAKDQHGMSLAEYKRNPIFS